MSIRQSHNLWKNNPQIPLQDAMKLNLNERIDVKLLMPIQHLSLFASEKLNNHLVQTIDSSSTQSYLTQYWDSSSYGFFYDHALGRSKRLKIRKRYYPSSNLCFLEIKKKVFFQTKKFRIPTDSYQGLNQADLEFLKSHNINITDLHPSLEVKYERTILWDPDLSGRITIDTDFAVKYEETEIPYDQVVIIEIKGSQNFINRTFQQLDIPKKRYQTSFSKYALGMMSIHPEIRTTSKTLIPIFKRLIKTNLQHAIADN